MPISFTYKKIALLIAMIMFLSIKPVFAQELSVSSNVYPSEITSGNDFEVILSLEGYADNIDSDMIRGIQIDIKGFESSIFQYKGSESLIEDNEAISNKTAFSSTNSTLRLIYVRMSGGLSNDTSNLMKITGTIKEDVESAGVINLPVSVKIKTVSQNITINSTIVINYKPKVTEIVSVDIEWGDLNFEYDNGIWNTESHNYENDGWKDNNDAYIKVVNTGNTNVVVIYSYHKILEEVDGNFIKQGDNDVTRENIGVGNETIVWLKLNGKPQRELRNEKIGDVVITLGG